MTYRVLILCMHLQRTIDRYRTVFAEHDVMIDVPSLMGKQQMSESDLLQIIEHYDGVIAGDDEFTASVLQKGKEYRLKVVSKWGIGVDGIDRIAAKRLGILVYNTPGAFPDEVADVAMGYIVMLARQLHKLHDSVKNGQWLKHPGITLRGKTLGVIGVGSIGQAIARRARSFGMDLLGYDPMPLSSDLSDEIGICSVSLDELLRSADFVALACALTNENRHLLSETQFAMMKNGVYLVNVARGPLVDERSLVKYLSNGKIAGAGLDVFEIEPLSLDNPLHQFDNCIFGTHNGSNTVEAVLRVNMLSIKNLFKGLGIEF